MLKTRYIKIKVTHLDQDRYFISANNEEGQFFFPSTWQYLLFNHHEESFFGTMVDVENIAGVEGVVLNGWQLATLLAREQYNRMIDWDWDDTAQLCLAAAPAILDSIME